MAVDALREAVALAGKVRLVFVEALEKEAPLASGLLAAPGSPLTGSGEANRLRQMACARSLWSDDVDRVTLDDWYAPETVDNLYDSPAVAIVVWDAATGGGYHLLGELEVGLECVAGAGYGCQGGSSRVRVRIGKVVAFGHAPAQVGQSA